MELPEEVLFRSYHALNYDWKPLSRNWGWLSGAKHCVSVYRRITRVSFLWREPLLYANPPEKSISSSRDRSSEDDLAASRYCKHESGHCATICWGSSWASAICIILSGDAYINECTEVKSGCLWQVRKTLMATRLYIRGKSERMSICVPIAFLLWLCVYLFFFPIAFLLWFCVYLVLSCAGMKFHKHALVP